jgi:hypothetical protein
MLVVFVSRNRDTMPVMITIGLFKWPYCFLEDDRVDTVFCRDSCQHRGFLAHSETSDFIPLNSTDSVKVYCVGCNNVYSAFVCA